jgi:hypothetical protein
LVASLLSEVEQGSMTASKIQDGGIPVGREMIADQLFEIGSSGF